MDYLPLFEPLISLHIADKRKTDQLEQEHRRSVLKYHVHGDHVNDSLNFQFTDQMRNLVHIYLVCP